MRWSRSLAWICTTRWWNEMSWIGDAFLFCRCCWWCCCCCCCCCCYVAVWLVGFLFLLFLIAHAERFQWQWIGHFKSRIKFDQWGFCAGYANSAWVRSSLHNSTFIKHQFFQVLSYQVRVMLIKHWLIYKTAWMELTLHGSVILFRPSFFLFKYHLITMKINKI